jgi:hypothetical protein
MDAITRLAELNSAVKWFMAYGTTTLMNDFNSNYPRFKLKESWIKGVQNEYQCARR